MTVTENIRAIFSILHDGTIIQSSGDKRSLTLKIECPYLAERINPIFDSFYLILSHVSILELITWPSPIDLPAETLTELDEIFKAELEILSAEIKENVVVVACNQQDETFQYCGGNLSVSCEEIRIFDQNKRQITIDELNTICKQYWQEGSAS